MKPEVTIAWFRRDLRLHDNAALYHALKSSHSVIPVFIFDTNILNQLEDTNDRRIEFIHTALTGMQQQLEALGSSLEIYHATPLEAFEALIQKFTIKQVFANHDYEQYAIDRDEAIASFLERHGTTLHTYKDQVIFEKAEVVKDDGKPYTVFTPYSKRWKATLNNFYLQSYPVEKYHAHFYKHPEHLSGVPSLTSIGFTATQEPFPSTTVSKSILLKYKEQRDFPAINGTSHLGVHLRFGTISIRELATKANQQNETYLNELIWRDFYHMILWHFPQVRKGYAFKKEYDLIPWRNNEAEFDKWCEGKTGYAIVDAGMRELNATGFMHNRVRMIVASFLTKHLLIDWRWGEAYFAKKLLDFDYAANNGGWQWAAGSGCDAAPYFRIFNPGLQTGKFDKDLQYIRKWIPEFGSFDYPAPIVQHEAARKRALEVYGKALKQQ